MNVLVLVPTRNRSSKLIRMMASAKSKNNTLFFLVGVDGDLTTEKRLKGRFKNIQVITFPTHVGSVVVRNSLVKQALATIPFDAMLVATDDIVFTTGGIDCAVQLLTKTFSNKLGFVGLKIGTIKHNCKAGVSLLWKEFVQRFPNGQLFYPGYYHFAAQELEQLGKVLGTMAFTDEACCVHHHPSLERYSQEFDSTHVDARRFKAKDRAVSSSRRKKKKIWGLAQFIDLLKKVKK